MKIVMARNTVSGQVGPVRESLLDHPHFKDQLELVSEDAKSYSPALYKSGTVEEKKAQRGETFTKTAESHIENADNGKADE